MTAARHVRLDLTPDGVGSSVLLDGVKLPAVRGVELSQQVHQRPRLVVDLVVWEVHGEAEEVRIELPDRTHEALVQLGWTPPGAS